MISVAMTTYNGAQYIIEQLESIRKQTKKVDEIVIVDDGSSDNTVELVRDYAYKYPGMNKVLQAAGRVIRTHDDVGIVALLDERFTGYQYQKMFPREWTDYEIVTGDTVGKRVTKFWDSIL